MYTQTIEYHDEHTLLEGFLAYDESKQGKRPAVLVAHDWSGRNPFACEKAEKLAELGYVGFALDMYGKNIIGRDNEEKSRLIAPFMQNRALLKQRMLAALAAIQKHELVDSSRIAVIGFCFGGLCALDLARSGADIRAAVSFHGLLFAPENLPCNKIKASILAMHGYNDPMVPPEQVNVFAKEMTECEADWQIHIYGHTAHAFTNPLANDPAFGTVYNEKANHRSWLAMKNFFNELLV